MSEKILCVDDDPSILQAFQRQLRKKFRIETAASGAEGLETIASSGPFAVIVSDMRMPGMDGIQFLIAAKERVPECTRVMLTGNADQQTAIDAVNAGQIFRFLTKPCPAETLVATLAAGVRQYQLVTAEKELLEKTLRGSVKVLTDVLSLTNPTAFGHASRIRRVVQRLCKQLNVDQPWQCEIAAMLSQIGCVTVPPDTLDKVYRGQALKPEEAQMLEDHPAVGRDLVANIPRLESVAEIIAYQQKRFDGAGIPADSVARENIPLGARILKVAIDFDELKWGGDEDVQVLVELRRRPEWYDPGVLAAMEAVIGFEMAPQICEIGMEDLTTKMVFAEDVKTDDGTLLISKGQEVTVSLRQRLRNFATTRTIIEPLRVLVRTDMRSPVTTQA